MWKEAIMAESAVLCQYMLGLRKTVKRLGQDSQCHGYLKRREYKSEALQLEPCLNLAKYY
jgi:hypothetical protein